MNNSRIEPNPEAMRHFQDVMNRLDVLCRPGLSEENEPSDTGLRSSRLVGQLFADFMSYEESADARVRVDELIRQASLRLDQRYLDEHFLRPLFYRLSWETDFVIVRRLLPPEVNDLLVRVGIHADVDKLPNAISADTSAQRVQSTAGTSTASEGPQSEAFGHYRDAMKRLAEMSDDPKIMLEIDPETGDVDIDPQHLLDQLFSDFIAYSESDSARERVDELMRLALLDRDQYYFDSYFLMSLMNRLCWQPHFVAMVDSLPAGLGELIQRAGIDIDSL